MGDTGHTGTLSKSVLTCNQELSAVI